MRLLSVTAIALLGIFTFLITNDSTSHNPVRGGTSHGSQPMVSVNDDNEVVIFYWEHVFDTSLNEVHPSTNSWAAAERTVTLPPGSKSANRNEFASATASVTAKDYTWDEFTFIPDGEYSLFTKVVFYDNTPPFTGVDTLDVGENSTVSDEEEYNRVVSGQDEGKSYTGAQTFRDTDASFSMDVNGDNCLGSMGMSWIKNDAKIEVDSVTISIDHVAAATASQ